MVVQPRQFPYLFVRATQADMTAYVHGFSSGYGVHEAIAYLKKQAEKGPITIIIRNDHGNPEDAMVAYFQYQKNSTVMPLNDYIFAQPILQRTKHPVYFVSRGGYYAGFQKYFVDKKIFVKPDDEEFVGVYRMEEYNY
jgi:hypothetical protein